MSGKTVSPVAYKWKAKFRVTKSAKECGGAAGKAASPDFQEHFDN